MDGQFARTTCASFAQVHGGLLRLVRARSKDYYLFIGTGHAGWQASILRAMAKQSGTITTAGGWCRAIRLYCNTKSCKY